jgi:hypothetical protein
LHAARFGVGPLTQELGTLFKTAAPSCQVRETAIAFHLVNGRIYHHDLELAFAECNVRTSGSVGLDGSLMLLAEMPIPAKLLASLNLPPAAAKQKIRVPIAGTIEQPRIDQKMLSTLNAQIIREVAADALKRELENKLKGRLKTGGGH